MNSTEFQDAIQNRYVVPKSVVQLSAFFKKEYSPEEMVKVMNHGTNGAQYLDKQKNGLNVWKYSCNTMTSGYIFCIVDDNPPSTGARSDKMEIPKELENVLLHATKGFLVGISLVIAQKPLDPSGWADIQTWLFGVLMGGVYGIAVEIANLLTPKTTAAKGDASPSIRDKLSL